MSKKVELRIRKLTAEFRNGEHLRKNYLSSTPHGGLMVPTTGMLEPGDIVELRVKCAGEEFDQWIRGAVLWCRKDAGIAKLAGIGFFASEVEKRECLLSLCSAYFSGDVERKNKRYNLDFQVAYEIQGDYVIDSAKNISSGGFYIESGNPPPVGKDFLFKIYLPEEEKPIELPGRVVWMNERGRVGVRFIPTASELSRKLENIIKKFAVEVSENTTDSVINEAASN